MVIIFSFLPSSQLFRATDLNLEEEEMVKLASLGHGGNHENAVQILKRSLALRNK